MNPVFNKLKISLIPETDQFSSDFSGANRKGILIITKSAAELSGEERNFLAKIMKAVDCELDEDNLFLNVKPNTQLSLAAVKRKHSFSKVVVFGASPESLGLNFTQLAYQPITVGEQEFLFADPLSVLYEERQRGGKQKSAQLWKALKMMFKNNLS